MPTFLCTTCLDVNVKREIAGGQNIKIKIISYSNSVNRANMALRTASLYVSEGESV